MESSQRAYSGLVQGDVVVRGDLFAQSDINIGGPLPNFI